jgi:RHS repeat-associated protein
VTNPLGDATSYVYDQAGQQTSTARADSTGTVQATTSYGYDPAGNRTSVTNPDGNTTSYAYDALNRLASVTVPVTASANDVRSYGYDAAGNRTEVTDGNGSATVTTYNSLGLPESVILPATTAYPSAAQRTFTVSYDASGRPASESEPGGISRTWAYDPLGDLTGQTGSGASATTPARSFGYDLAGQLTSYSAPGGTMSVGYDDRGLPVSVTGGGQPAQSYAWNTDGQLTSRTDAAGTATFGYDTAGRLASLTDPLTGAALAYGYDKASELTSINYGTGADSQALGYDALGRVTSDTLTTSAGATIASASYGYDKAGYLTSKTTAGTAGAGTSSYGYDLAGWLTSWKNPAGTTTNYGYDNAGNLTSAGSATYSYNQQDQLTSATSGSGTTSYTYAASGTLSQVSGPSVTTSYAFDAYGDMASAGTLSYGYDALGRLAQRTDSSGTTSLAYDGPSALTPSAVLTSSGQVSQDYTRDPAGNLVSATAGGAASIAWTDPLHGDLTGLLSPAGSALTASAAYDPWGNITASGGTMPSLGYQGGYTDPATGLVNMGARWYNPATGGFTAADALGLIPATSGAVAALGDPLAGGGPGPYGYATDNPLTSTDLTGHYAEPGGASLRWATRLAVGVDAAGAGPEDPIGDIAAGGAFLVGYEIGLFTSSSGGGYYGLGCSCANLPNLSNLPDLSNLSGLNFSGLSSFSGIPDINWSSLPNFSGIPGGIPDINWTNFGGFPYPLGLAIQLPPPCLEACLQAKQLLQNENKILARPHENPAVTQAQLDAQRAAIEAKAKRQVANVDYT